MGDQGVGREAVTELGVRHQLAMDELAHRSGITTQRELRGRCVMALLVQRHAGHAGQNIFCVHGIILLGGVQPDQ